MNEMKLNALKNRQYKNNKGCPDYVLKEIVEEYEAKIKQLEFQINNNSQLDSLKNQVFEL